MERDIAQIDRGNMEKAIAAAQQCCPIDHSIPKVGAVIAIRDRIIATGTRGSGEPGDDDHAEMIAINSASDQSQFAEATLYTTLEPCTPEVRSRPLTCCTSLIKQYHFRRVHWHPRC
jgi:diaminohydroxyphosphoribosylaminopyrimidine deaminase/5-amino-6-(5-phosphoribosylamino)uracil reductase